MFGTTEHPDHSSVRHDSAEEGERTSPISSLGESIRFSRDDVTADWSCCRSALRLGGSGPPCRLDLGGGGWCGGGVGALFTPLQWGWRWCGRWGWGVGEGGAGVCGAPFLALMCSSLQGVRGWGEHPWLCHGSWGGALKALHELLLTTVEPKRRRQEVMLRPPPSRSCC